MADWSLEAPVPGGTTLLEILPAPVDEIKQVDDRAEIVCLFRRLSDRNAQIVWDYHARGMTLAAIGRREGLTESRISQIVSESLALMRVA